MSKNNELELDLHDDGAIPSLDDEGGDVLGAPNTDKKKKTNANKAFILLLFLVAFLFLIFGVMWFVKGRHPKAPAPVEAKKGTSSVMQKNVVIESDLIEKTKEELKAKQAAEEKEKADAAAIAAAEAEAAALAAEAEKNKASNKTAPNQAPANNGQQHANNGHNSGNNGNKQLPPTPAERRLSGNALVDITEGKKETPATSNGNAGNSQIGGAGSGGGNSSGIAATLQPTVLVSRNAGRLSDLDYLLKRGTSIPCALETGIDTTLAGFVVCKVTNDVYSANSKTLLIERGASIFGEQQSSLKQGQERTFVLWTRIDNPNGVTANLDSPATDQMGYNGVPGYVDTHFWQRFGGAILMSFIKDFSASLKKDSPSTQNTSQGGADIATETLRNSINIPPTLTVRPATVVYVLVARDINFSSVYTLVK